MCANVNTDDGGDDTTAAAAADNKSYKYLTGMPLISLSLDRMEALLQEKGNKEAELSAVQNTTPEQFWLSDLATFDAAYGEFLIRRLSERTGNKKATIGGATKTAGAKKTRATAK